MLLSAFIAAVMLMSCGSDPEPSSPTVPSKPGSGSQEQKDDGGDTGEQDSGIPDNNGSGTLVVWYSFTGNSKAIAAALRSYTGADEVEIKPAADGLDYAANNYEIGSSLISAIRSNPASASSYPAIKDVSVDLGKYETVIIVTPLWWSQMAAPMQSFLFANGGTMAGKTIGLVVTSASSPIDGVESDARRLVPKGRFMPESLWIRSSQVGSAMQMVSGWYDRMFPSQNDNKSMKAILTAGGKTFEADIEDSETGKAFLEKLPMTLEMSELNGNEKYCYGISLPRSDKRYDSIAAGDLMLYSGNCVVVFYGPSGGYSYTRIGKIPDVTGLSGALGNGSVTVKFERK